MNSRDKNNMRVQNCGYWLGEYLRHRQIHDSHLGLVAQQIRNDGFDANIDQKFDIEDANNAPHLTDFIVALEAFKRAQNIVRNGGTGEDHDVRAMESAVRALSRQPIFEMSTRGINDGRVRACGSRLERYLAHRNQTWSDLHHAARRMMLDSFKADLTGLKLDTGDGDNALFMVAVEALAAFKRVQSCIQNGDNEDEAVLAMQKAVSSLPRAKPLEGVPLQDVRDQIPTAKP